MIRTTDRPLSPLRMLRPARRRPAEWPPCPAWIAAYGAPEPTRAGRLGFIAVQPATQPGFDWKKWLPIIALAVAALLLLTGAPKKKRRRKALKKARAGYRQKVGRIEARYT